MNQIALTTHISPYQTPYKFSGKEKDEESGYSYFGARYYDSDLSVWLSVDPMAGKYPGISPYAYCANNPVMLVDPNGMDIDPTELTKSKDHTDAAIQFAKTKEGKAFLDKYASAGQKFVVNGEVVYEAKEAGEYDKKGIILKFDVNNSDVKSTTGGDYSNKKDGYFYEVRVSIARKGFGSDNTVFNLAGAITHELFFHVDGEADDMLDDGYANNSYLPKFYRKYGKHADHYYVSREYLLNNQNASVQSFPVSGLNLLKQVSTSLKLGYSDTQIKTFMWYFSGSLISVDPKTGKLSYQK
jgi:RHS repeat-associated protein